MDINSMLSNGAASPATSTSSQLDNAQRRTSVASLLNSESTTSQLSHTNQPSSTKFNHDAESRDFSPASGNYNSGYSHGSDDSEKSDGEEVSDEDNSEEGIETPQINSRVSHSQKVPYINEKEKGSEHDEGGEHPENDEEDDDDDELERELENLEEEFEEPQSNTDEQSHQYYLSSEKQSPELRGQSHAQKHLNSQQNPTLGRLSSVKENTPATVNAQTRTPQKYSVPPIWALKWRPYNRLLEQGLSAEQARVNYLASYQAYPTPSTRRQSRTHDNSTFGSTILPNANSNSSKPIPEVVTATNGNPPTLVTLTGLAPCISGFKPFEEITRLIATWLLGNLQRMTEEERENMELEIKLGVLYNKISKERINLNIASEAIVERNYKADHLYFEPGLHEEQFEGLKTVLSSLKSLRKESTLYRDTAYTNLRVTEDRTTNRIVERVNKVRISDLVVNSPGDLLDYRISLSTELPVLDNVEPRGRANSVRIKNRDSYISPGVRIDVTEVTTVSQGNHLTHEVELESDGKALLSYFNGLGEPSTNSGDKFEEMIQILLDNTRFINRKISRN
ncbi:mRNA triphosphatase CET1 [Nadsonia fulvescens var. elongata DSM 6958]|uniref:mRNA-capping enzyme subunit beta n=1 Tax=Nadsonia fulvescens var. elongata DSM 6958 TaxID=857566 RepID=A0A1E3PI19_9ASCO|nr:mRNA triphosphatase CET1 [Nadsonia fulvescens var. elongata DSM 6958]